MRGLSGLQYELLADNDRACRALSAHGNGEGFTPAQEASLRELEERQCIRWCECGCGFVHPEVTSAGRDARAIHEWLHREVEK